MIDWAVLIGAIGLVLTATYLFLVFLQLRAQNKQLATQNQQMSFEALTQLHKELISKDMQRALRVVYAFEPTRTNTTSIGELEAIELVLNTYDLIGYRISRGVLPKNDTLETEWSVILGIWKRLEAFVIAQRKPGQRGNDRYKFWLEKLVKQAREYQTDQQHNYPDPETHPRGFYNNPKPCVGVFIRNRNGEVLWTRRKFDPCEGKLDIPGGFLQPGEHPREAAYREVREETGLRIREYRCIGIFMDIYGSPDESTLNVCYVTAEFDGEEKAADDVLSLEWHQEEDSPPGDIAFNWITEAYKRLRKDAQASGGKCVETTLLDHTT